jgi:hypothetical protein
LEVLQLRAGVRVCGERGTLYLQRAEETRLFIEASKRKLESLRDAIAELQATVEESRLILAESVTLTEKAKPFPWRPLLPLLSLTLQTREEKAAETRAFAEAVSNRKVKLLLLEAADIQKNVAR